MIAHHLTIDVEEYFHPTALAPHYPVSTWESLERRSPLVIAKLLDLLAERGVLGTFFVVGWLARREPQMVRAIAEAGHEVASHGWEHELVGRLGPEGFRHSIRRSKAVLEEITGAPVVGYRAPSFSIVPGLEWAFDALLEEGYRYDASLFPVTQHPVYGYPDAERHPSWLEREGGRLLEIPASTARVLGMTLPASGGAYFRLLPYALVRTALAQTGARNRPGTFYLHPWELDDWVPDSGASFLTRFRTFGGRTRTWSRLRRLLDEFAFQPVLHTLTEMAAAGASAAD